LKSGNLKAKEVENEEEDENVVKENREQTVERLLKLSRDGNEWSIKLVGFSDLQKLDKKPLSYGINLLQSLKWPGSVTLGYKNVS